ncbi:glycosyl hydrolases family 43-domain-containing protein [Chaetomium strumarium]|uniref:Glycosyl hydrolases family 43-domain-containing protein n=1 Tax=Chaetomium strumarium TaxID=1170767 RepID=A0AAJ0GMJ1_9PEZI|nr:glycosyl hydrolases family 43-domain-containing protein [Chaetomium strumarium]
MHITGRIFTAVSVFTAAWLMAVSTPAAASPAVSYANSLIQQRADPHISKHDGWYYFTATVPEYDRIILRRAQSIQTLASAAETTIWRRKASGYGSGQVWAPELHFIDGKWYVYVALGVANQWNIRTFVLEGTGANPLTASWVEKGQIRTNWDTFTLDASTFVANGTRYLIWAQGIPDRPDENSSIMIAPLENPWTIRGRAVAISHPGLPWERIGYKVNEGPYVIQRNGRIFLTYSASATDYNYCMGLLTASAGSDLMNPASWSKSQTPIFTSNAKTNQWGPGHNSFVESEDGQSDIMVYHDRGYRDIRGDPLNDPNRRTRVQKVYWKDDGTPDFGIPVPEGNTPVRLRSAADHGTYIRYYTGSASPTGTPALADTQFRIVSPGLAGGSTISLESTSNPGMFLRRAGGAEVQFVKDTTLTTADTKASASFNRVPGLADVEGVSLELSDAKAQYLSLRPSGKLVVAPVNGQVEEQKLATFFSE